MIIYFKCYLADGSERTHSYELQARSLNEAVTLIEKTTDAIMARMEHGRALPMPNPATYYASGQVIYVEIGFAEDAKELEQKIGQVFDRKLGFLKE